MPLFFLIFLVLAVRVFFLPGAAEGYRFMFTPRWEALADPMIWIWAMGQAFFSLSVTGSGMIVYGAVSLPSRRTWSALHSTRRCLIPSRRWWQRSVIIPACFSYGLDVGAGPGLLFVTLPTILQDIPLGQLFAVILYIAMIFAGVSSLQNMFEAVAESLQHRFPRLSRTATLVILGAVPWLRDWYGDHFPVGPMDGSCFHLYHSHRRYPRCGFVVLCNEKGGSARSQSIRAAERTAAGCGTASVGISMSRWQFFSVASHSF